MGKAETNKQVFQELNFENSLLNLNYQRALVGMPTTTHSHFQQNLQTEILNKF